MKRGLFLFALLTAVLTVAACIARERRSGSTARNTARLAHVAGALCRRHGFIH